MEVAGEGRESTDVYELTSYSLKSFIHYTRVSLVSQTFTVGDK